MWIDGKNKERREQETIHAYGDGMITNKHRYTDYVYLMDNPPFASGGIANKQNRTTNPRKCTALYIFSHLYDDIIFSKKYIMYYVSTISIFVLQSI